MAEDDLALSLEKAANDPAHRPDFLRGLLAAKIYVIGQVEGSDASGEQMLQPGARVSIQNSVRADGTNIIPFFSSVEKLQAFIREPGSYLAFPARDFFEMTAGAFLVLNPGADYGKEFTPEEIGNLLSYGTDAPPNSRVVEKETKVLVGQPAVYPHELVASLARFFATRPNVGAAWLAMMHDTSVDEHPHLIVGVEAEGDFGQLSREMGAIITATSETHGPVDVMQVIRSEQGMAQYFLQSVEPFYRRQIQ